MQRGAVAYVVATYLLAIVAAPLAQIAPAARRGLPPLPFWGAVEHASQRRAPCAFLRPKHAFPAPAMPLVKLTAHFIKHRTSLLPLTSDRSADTIWPPDTASSAA